MSSGSESLHFYANHIPGIPWQASLLAGDHTSFLESVAAATGLKLLKLSHNAITGKTSSA